MSILFKEFLNKHHVSGLGVLMELKKIPPLAQYLERSPAFYNKYQQLLQDPHQRELLETSQWIIDEHTASLNIQSFDLSSKFRFWGNLDLNMPQAHIAFQALKFQIAQLGDPLSRASFAALKLYEMLSPLAAKIYLKTNTQIAHPAVYIKLVRQWWIFDANLNPELIFNHQDYRHQVIKYLPKTKHQVPQLNIQIKPELWLLFQKQLPKLQALLKHKLEEKPVEQLINREHPEELVDESIDMLQKRMF